MLKIFCIYTALRPLSMGDDEVSQLVQASATKWIGILNYFEAKIKIFDMRKEL